MKQNPSPFNLNYSKARVSLGLGLADWLRECRREKNLAQMEQVALAWLTEDALTGIPAMHLELPDKSDG